MKSFIDKFLDYTADMESPTSFWKWAAIATVAAVMRDNCFLRHGPFTLIYPNLYILLYARSSAVKKGNPLIIAERLVRAVGNTKIISGRASMPGVIKALADVHTTENGTICKGASCFLHSEELSSFVVDDKKSIDILTDWYGYHEKWDNYLSSSPISYLNKVCVTLFSGTNDELIKDIFTTKAIYGGLLARTILVREERRRKKNSLMFAETKRDDASELLEHLKHIATQKGEMQLDLEAKRVYDEWYNSIEDDRMKSGAGVEGRIPTTVLKIAMILSMTERGSMMILREDIENAIDTCLSVLKNYQQLIGGVGKSPIIDQQQVVLLALLRAPSYRLTKKEIMRNLWGDIGDMETLDKVLDTFQAAGMINMDMYHNEIQIMLNPEVIKQFERTTLS